MPHEILIVDDERVLREELADFFQSQGLHAVIASCVTEALERVDGRDFDVILTDIRMPDADGIELIRQLRERAPETQVLVMTAHPTVDTAVAALRLGAADYIKKPLILVDLLHKVRYLIEFRSQKRELRWLRQQLAGARGDTNIVGKSKAIEQLHALIARAADIRSTVLITGESGTGKELVARAIHDNGPWRDKHFVPLNCAAIPAALMESQLFGHRRGAYTGAEGSRDGSFVAAHGGTLFLDEVGDLPLELQPKLLRAIENHEIIPLGADEPIKVDARIVASTNKDLPGEVSRGAFREDLYYRLAVLTIETPPLRERIEDVPLLVEFFIESLNRNMRRKITGVTNETLRYLLQHHWQGNVRELKNVIERAMILEDGELITPASLPSTLAEKTRACDLPGPLKNAVREFEVDYVQTILRATDGDKKLAAELLGVSLASLYRRLQNIEDDAG